MTGLERNKIELLDDAGKIFLAAFDHPQIYGVMSGLENPLQAIENIEKTEIGGFILNPGIFNLVDAQLVHKKKMILRSSLGGTSMAKSFPDTHDIMVSPHHALSLGADAILIMMVLGGEHDKESMMKVATTVADFQAFSIPVIVEVLAADFTKNNDTEFVKNGARIAAELGADFVKAFYCENFKTVIDGCPVPIILAGGPKDTDILPIAKSVVDDGAIGFAFGRNIFQSKDPKTLIKNLSTILRR